MFTILCCEAYRCIDISISSAIQFSPGLRVATAGRRGRELVPKWEFWNFLTGSILTIPIPQTVYLVQVQTQFKRTLLFRLNMKIEKMYYFYRIK